jgi:hypothetical protein
MHPHPFPTVKEVQRIVDLKDPVIRNLQITQCYHELSTVLAARTGMSANWCTFATWASRQAGQTIRKEDLARLLESRLQASQSSRQAAESVARNTSRKGLERFDGSHDRLLKAENFKTSIDRASDAVGRGNKKVFEEIAREFARFYETCFPDPPMDGEKIARFCEDLRPGDPPEGQDFLRRAFTHYARALIEQDPKTRAEAILLANVEVGFHEQTRLQPEITESLDAGWTNFGLYTRPLFAQLFPIRSWLSLTHLYARRLLGRPTALDLALKALIDSARSHLRQAITETMMVISLPSGVRLSLSDDLDAGFPDTLMQITDPELNLLLETYDPTPNSPTGSGAIDWGDLPDRLHFIIDLFRCYQENRDLFTPPFTLEQVEALKSGRLPSGRL